MQPPASKMLRTMIARISPDDIVLYANSSLANYLRVAKRTLIGSPIEIVAKRASGEISSCFSRPVTGRTSNRLVTDSDGRVFEAKSYSDGGVLDIVLDEVTNLESIGRDLRSSSGTAVERLNEDELRTARQPERRFLTVSHTTLRNLSEISGRQAPMEVRLMINAFIEECSEAILETGCSVGETSGEAVAGLYGAPRYFADHALRAMRAACDQMARSTQLRATFSQQGKELPPIACGMWTGETLIGTIGSSLWQHYTAIGTPVDMARELTSLCRPGEVLLPAFTLTQIISSLPPGWQYIRAESETEPDLSDFKWPGDNICALPENLRRVVYLFGPDIEEHLENVEFYLDYLWALKVPGVEHPVPILRVVRPASVGDAIELNEDNVVTTQMAQTLGKYKLLSVIGTGGMGKVWKGQDRFGNIVAIKVLHSSEAASESQIKRFRREAEVMARLPHRNICRVFEMNEFEGIHYIAMEFVDGLTLADLLYEKTPEESSGQVPVKTDLHTLIKSLHTEIINREIAAAQSDSPESTPPRPLTTRILPFDQTLNIFLKVSDAVQFAHEHGVLHRDLKPGNILLREDGEALVADFGLAKINSANDSQSLSVTGHVVGTLENMAPEQAESSKEVDERADVYSLGTILYQMLTGQRHFAASGNIVGDAQALKTHEPVRPRLLNPKIDSDLEIITLKALRNLPEERYRTIAAFRADLERYRNGEVISAKAVSVPELLRKLVLRNKAISAVIAASILILIIGGVVSFWQISQALIEAQAQKSLAEKQFIEADLQRQKAEAAASFASQESQRAEERTAEANQAKEAAEKALEQSKTDRALAADAKVRSEKAAEETQAEREARMQVEEFAKNREQELQKRILEIESSSKPEQETKGPRMASDQEESAAKRMLGEAFMTFGSELSPPELNRQEKSPDVILRRLNKAIDNTAKALLVRPDFSPGWMLKGRLHLACMETDRAIESFQQAAKMEVERIQLGQDPLIVGDDPEKLSLIAEELSRTMGERYTKGANLIKETRLTANQNLVPVLQFFAGKPNFRKTSLGGNIGNSPLGRQPTVGEAALALLTASGNQAHITLKEPPGEGAAILIGNIGEAGDLSPFRNVGVTSLTLLGTKTVDWKSIVQMPLDSLDLSGCAIDYFPENLRAYIKLRSLKLTNTKISSLSFIRWMQSLEELDISNTLVTDVNPLLGRSRLQKLNLGGLPLPTLNPIRMLPLESLTFSPNLIEDKTSIQALRTNRRLAYLRTPDDPELQTPADFWRKYDSGAYTPKSPETTP